MRYDMTHSICGCVPTYVKTKNCNGTGLCSNLYDLLFLSILKLSNIFPYTLGFTSICVVLVHMTNFDYVNLYDLQFFFLQMKFVHIFLGMTIQGTIIYYNIVTLYMFCFLLNDRGFG